MEAHKACFPGNAVLRQRLDDWTEEFEAGEAQKKRDAAAAQEEQGWTVVKRRGVSYLLHMPAQAILCCPTPCSDRSVPKDAANYDWQAGLHVWPCLWLSNVSFIVSSLHGMAI